MQWSYEVFWRSTTNPLAKFLNLLFIKSTFFSLFPIAFPHESAIEIAFSGKRHRRWAKKFRWLLNIRNSALSFVIRLTTGGHSLKHALALAVRSFTLDLNGLGNWSESLRASGASSRNSITRSISLSVYAYKVIAFPITLRKSLKNRSYSDGRGSLVNDSSIASALLS